jgi:hypothetical protein
MIKYLIGNFFLLIFYFPAFTQHELPATNQRIIKYINEVIGDRVGRGECWDLADEALKRSHAKFDKSSEKSLYIFGREYNPGKENIIPGDIIQFKNVVVKYRKGNAIMTETMSHHTAIVYEVLNERKIMLAHQNTSRMGKKVGISQLDLDSIQKGKLFFYRPIPDD